MEIWLSWLLATIGMQLLGYAISVLWKTERLFDLFGSANFLLIAIVTLALSDDPRDPRRIVSSAMFATSRAWLMVFLSLRAHERGDSRFDKVKDSWVFALFWLGQAGWVYLISMPILAINIEPWSVPLGSCDIAWAALFGVALLTQVHSDYVKKQWVEEGREGVFCRRGCWDWSRHPNYFGEVAMTVAAVGLAGPLMLETSEHPGSTLAIVSVLSPIYTFCVLMFVTGVPLAEGKALQRYYKNARDAYVEYREKTPVLLPCCCPGFELVPRWAKSLFCCEWGLYELPAPEEAEIGFAAETDVSFGSC